MRATRQYASLTMDYDVVDDQPIAWQLADDERNQRFIPDHAQIRLLWRDDAWIVSGVTVSGGKVKKDGTAGLVTISNGYSGTALVRGDKPAWLDTLISYAKRNATPVPIVVSR